VRVAISASGPDLDSSVDPRFGRCAYLVFADTQSMDFEAVANPNVSAGGGAGISTAQMVIDKGAEAVITGNMGPNAFGVLNQAGIPVYTGAAGSLRQALESLASGDFDAAQSPTVGGHYGTQAPAAATGPSGPPGPSGGFPSPGTGAGGGMGGGRGMGRGRGGGGGRGRW
jgi:predicted Fe-Mo cluster-binding NifX family protein